MRKNNIKNIRINMEVLRELSEIIRNGIEDSRAHLIIGVVSVEITPNLKYCKVYVSVSGNEGVARAAIEGLKNMEGYVRGELARRTDLHNIPEFKLILNQPIEYGVSMSKLVNKVAKDLHQGEGQDKEGEEGGT